MVATLSTKHDSGASSPGYLSGHAGSTVEIAYVSGESLPSLRGTKRPMFRGSEWVSFLREVDIGRLHGRSVLSKGGKVKADRLSRYGRFFEVL